MPRISRSRSASGGSRPRSRSPTPRSRRGRSPSGSRSPSPSRSRSPLSRGSRSRSRSRSKSRSRSHSQGKSSGGLTGVTLSYDDFTPAEEEKPTFALDQATIDLITSKAYHASPLNKKFFNELKRDKYMMAREVNESLEPKPIPAQVVSSVGGYDLNKLHGGLLHQHKVNRLAQRPIWALMEELQKSRILLKDAPPTQFNSPPYMGTGAVPDGFIPLDFSVEEERRHAAQAPVDPSAADFADVHKRLGVHIKYHGVAERAMQSMVDVIKVQQEMLGHMKLAHDAMWVRSQDYLNMARYQETHLKDMRRSQLVKAHTRDFNEWLESVYMKDKSKLGDRDRSDEILAANYDAVIKQYQEDRKNKNIALKQSGGRGRDWNRRGGGGGSHSRDSRNSVQKNGGNVPKKEDNKSDYRGRSDKEKEKKGSGRGKTSQGGRGGGKGPRNDRSGDKKDKTV